MATRLLGADDRTHIDKGHLGQRVMPGHEELFVAGGPAAALAHQFQRHRPEFLVVHQIGGGWTRKLLASIAAASHRSIQQLAIRREGVGTPLATIEYIECPGADGVDVRIYSTELPQDADATPMTRQQMALVLLAYSRLGVIMVGDMSVPAMHGSFAPLHQAMVTGPWPSRHLLLLPLTSAGALASLGTDISEDTGIAIRTTPQVTRTTDAWAFISGSWNRMREDLRPRGIHLPALPGARNNHALEQAPVSQPEPDSAGMPAPSNASTGSIAGSTAGADEGTDASAGSSDSTGGAATREAGEAGANDDADAAKPSASTAGTDGAEADKALASSGASPVDPALTHLIEQVAKLNGVQQCCVFHVDKPESAPGHCLVSGPGCDAETAESLAGAASQWVRSALAGLQSMSAPATHQESSSLSYPPEVTLSSADRHFLVRKVPGHPELALVARFSRASKPMLCDAQMRRIEADAS